MFIHLHASVTTIVKDEAMSWRGGRHGEVAVGVKR